MVKGLTSKIWYALVLALAGCLVPVLQKGIVELSTLELLWPLVLLTLGVWFGLHRVVWLGKGKEGDYRSVYTLDDSPTFAIIFLYSTSIATAIVVAIRLCYEVVRLVKGLLKHRDRVTGANVVYHFSDVVFVGLVTLVAGTVLDLLGRPSPLTGAAGAAAAFLAGLVWLVVYFFCNALHVTVAQGKPEEWWRSGLEAIKGNVGNIALFLPIGILISAFVIEKPWITPLFFLPVVLVHMVMQAKSKLEEETQSTIMALSTYLEERDQYTSGHSLRVAGYAAAIARHIGLSAAEVETTYRAGIIHDLGKIDIPDAILRKPGFLNEEERDVMRTHTDRAVSLGEKLVALKDGLPFAVAAYHHENWNGSGYYGLAGENIPIVSRMLAVADTWDAMTSDRPYRKGMDDSEALLRLKKAAGSQLDPRMVTAFFQTFDLGEVHKVRSAPSALLQA